MSVRNELKSMLGPSDILAFARETLRFQPDEHQARLQPRRPGKPDRFVTHEDLDEHQRAILKKGLGGPVGEQGYPPPWF